MSIHGHVLEVKNVPPCSGKPMTIAFALLPEQSAFNASYSLAKRLSAKGYRVIYGGPEKFHEHVAAQGFEYFILGSASAHPADVEIEENSALKRWWRTRQRYADSAKNMGAVFGEYEDLLKSESVDLVLADPIAPALALPPLKLKIPVLNFNTSLASTFSIHYPPAFSHLTLECRPAGLKYLRNGIAWLRCLFRPWYRILRGKTYAIKYLLPPSRSVADLIRKLGGKVSWSEYGPRLKVPELVVCPKEFDFAQASRKTRIYVGTCVDEGRHDGAFDWGEIDREKPIVYCSLGTYSHAYPHSQRLFKAVVDATMRHAELQAVIQIGSSNEVDAFGLLPSSIKLVKRVPQLELLAHSNIFITHGGLSSIREAIYFGVPMLVFPCWMEQPGNASRVSHHGLGLRGDISTIDTPTLESMLEQIQDPSFKASILKMQSKFRSQETCEEGVEFIERFTADLKTCKTF